MNGFAHVHTKGNREKQYGEEAEKQFLFNFLKKMYEGLQYQKYIDPHQIIHKKECHYYSFLSLMT